MGRSVSLSLSRGSRSPEPFADYSLRLWESGANFRDNIPGNLCPFRESMSTCGYVPLFQNERTNQESRWSFSDSPKEEIAPLVDIVWETERADVRGGVVAVRVVCVATALHL